MTPVLRASLADDRDALVHERLLSAVRASPGITTERASSVARCSIVEACRGLDHLVGEDLVEEAELQDGSAWFPIDWCHTCGCTETRACDEGCEWAEAPGSLPHLGPGAGICSRCA